MKRFVAIGECMIEIRSAMGETYRLGYAGDTLNTAWYARARLGEGWAVDYATALGDDDYSSQMREFMAGNGIGTGHIQTIAGRRPGLYLIHQADGDRHFTYWRDTSAARFMAEDREALEAGLIGADMVYFSGISLAILGPRSRGRLIGSLVKARNAGATLAFDPNIRPALWSSDRAMRSMLTVGASVADIVLPTFSDEAPVFGDASPDATAARYLELGAQEVVVKNGAEPSVVVAKGERHEVVPGAVANIVDTTGAGDSFNGGYLAARLTGLGLHEAAEAGHSVAGRVIGQSGALVDMALVR